MDQGPPELQRVQRDACFQCGKLGHWARNCPEKGGRVDGHTHLNATPTDVDSEYPATYCRCGRGLCQIRVSGSDKNPGRKYYNCPESGLYDCKFFKWCDQMRKDEILTAPPKAFPICGCRAGVCTIIKKAGLCYFVCPIKKGQGACDFSQLQDGQTDIIRYGQNDGLEEQMLPEEEVLGEMEGWGGCDIARSSPGHDFPVDVLEYVEFLDDVAKSGYASESTPTRMCELNCSENVCRDSNKTPGDHQPVESRRLTPVPENPSSAGSSEIMEMENHHASYFGKRLRLESCSDNQHGMKFLAVPVSVEGSPEEANSIMAGSIVKVFDKAAADLQRDLIDLLYSMSPQDHATMSKEADCIFAALSRLQVNYHLFSVHVRAYIERAASLAEKETAFVSNISSEELLKQYQNKKAQIDEVAALYDEAKKALVDSNTRLFELQKNDHSNDKYFPNNMVVLSCHKVEAAERYSQVVNLSDQLSQLTRSLEVLSMEIAEDVKQREDRDVELSAAKAAFEKARAQLCP